jgi:hypothetical protein
MDEPAVISRADFRRVDPASHWQASSFHRSRPHCFSVRGRFIERCHIENLKQLNRECFHD